MSFTNTKEFTCDCGRKVQLTYGGIGFANERSLKGIAHCECGLYVTCSSIGTRNICVTENPVKIVQRTPTMSLRLVVDGAKRNLQQLHLCVDNFGRDRKIWEDVPEFDIKDVEEIEL